MTPDLTAPTITTWLQERVAQTGRAPDALLPLLQAVHEHWGYLPNEVLHELVAVGDFPLAQIEGVASFYSQWRRRPAGKHILRVCHGTACHVQGSGRLEQELRRLLHLTPDADTDASGQFTIEGVACVGCCSMAPVIQTDARIYGTQTASTLPALLKTVTEPVAAIQLKPMLALDAPVQVRVCLDSCCVAKGTDALYTALQQALRGVRNIRIQTVVCNGLCQSAPMVEVVVGDQRQLFGSVRPEQIPGIVAAARGRLQPWRKVLTQAAQLGQRWLTGTHTPAPAEINHAGPVATILAKQQRQAMAAAGTHDPLDWVGYLKAGGWQGWLKAQSMTPAQIRAEVTAAGLRGRGGAGYPSGRKWELVAAAPGDKVVIVNGDEGDPGAFMDRMLLESFPFRVLEGAQIAARAVGASAIIFYIRAEYPMAVARIEAALALMQARQLLTVPCRVQRGAGAYICGEETALIASLEGQRGVPRLRPPYPAQSGWHGQPTLVNNVETLALVPSLIATGATAFRATGTTASPGTKVFCLAGKLRHPGLVEVPMGLSLHDLIHDLGGGMAVGGKLKGVLLGGPSGACIPADQCHVPVDFEALQSLGGIMGSGGIIALDQSDCMLDLCLYFARFSAAESCGKCVPCRYGTRRMVTLLEGFVAGNAKPGDVAQLQQICQHMQQASMCGLGRNAPRLVLSALQYFPDEWTAHQNGQCPAGVCKALIKYEVTADCIGCSKCAQVCPVQAIPLLPYQKAKINLDLCTQCDLCRTGCPQHAIAIMSGSTAVRR